MRPLAATLAMAVAIALTGCGDDDHDKSGGVVDREWTTITDPQTGKSFRCFYVDGNYASDLLCYEPERSEP